ncbi:11602_t:CDS:2, partial [Racocetra persica]
LVNGNSDVMSSDSEVDCEIREDNIELAIELGFEKDNITSVSCPLPDELSNGIQFDSWEVAELYIREYRKKKGFVVNKYRTESSFDGSNGVYLSFIELNHNHDLNIDNIKHCNIHTIRNLLQPLFPDQLFFTQDLSNAIQKIKHKYKITGSDASQLLKYLFEKQKKESMMFIQPLINKDSDRLCANKYNYPLSLFILVDNDERSRLEAQTFLNDKMQESY